MRQIFGDIGWEKKAMVFFSGVLILAIIGPFGTYEDLTFWERLVFWTAIFTGVGFFAHVMMTLCLDTQYLGKLNRLVRLAIGAAVAAIPGAAIVVFVNLVFRPQGISADTLPYVWFQVAIISYLIGVVEYIDWGLRTDKPAELTVTRLHDRLPPEIGDDIVSMSMQDHYVEVTTTEGNHLCLLRMSDAIAELEGLPGQRVHRSHWVASRHMRSLSKQNTRKSVVLSDGRDLPVSDTYLADLTALLDEKQFELASD